MMRGLLFVVSTVLAMLSSSKAWEQYNKCDLEYEKVGCFVDKPGDQRTLPEELLNERDKTNPHYDGHIIEWERYGESLHGLACRCAAKTRDKGYKMFGLQFYGECWSGPGAESTYDKYGVADKKKCIQDIYSPSDIYCAKIRKQECIGGPHTNYVYRIKAPALHPVSGGYTPWSSWTPCTKTCGGGTTSRSRTCTNPKPMNGGDDCSSLGESEELQACGDIPCPVDGGYSLWNGWTPCTKTCGGGTTSRSRTCTNPKPKNGGDDCSSLGASEEIKACSEDVCTLHCNKALDIGIIMDGSSSVYRRNFRKAKFFFKTMTNFFKVSPQGTHFGVIVYSTRARMEFTFANRRYHYPRALSERIKAIRYPRGWTRTDRALEMASKQLFTPSGGDRADKPNVLIVFTDGKTNRGSKPYSRVLSPLKAKNVKIIAIGIGRNISEKELKTIAMGNANNVIRISNFNRLHHKLNDLLQGSCNA